MALKNILGQNAFWMVNKSLCKVVGIEAALLLSDFIDKYSYYEGHEQLFNFDNELYFYCTSNQILESTTLTYRLQKKCIQILEKKELIKIKLTGIPAKLHFTICENKVCEIVNISINKNAKLDSTKTQTKKEYNNKNKNKKK